MNSQSQAVSSNPERPVHQSFFGLRGRMLLLAIVPVLLAGGAIFYSMYNNVGDLGNFLYETRTNKTMQILMGNIDFTKPKEIEREFKQAMADSDIITMYLIQTNANGGQSSQVIFRDGQGKAIFESREPKYVAAKGNFEAEREYFLNLTYATSIGSYVTRGTGLGSLNGALETRMLGLSDETKLGISNGTALASNFGLVVVEDSEKLDSSLWAIGWTMIWSIIAAVVIAAIIGFLVAQGIVRPVVQLTKLANAMSIGDLDTPIEIRSRDEIGTLAQALERTRLSLKLALERTQRKRIDKTET